MKRVRMGKWPSVYLQGGVGEQDREKGKKREYKPARGGYGPGGVPSERA